MRILHVTDVSTPNYFLRSLGASLPTEMHGSAITFAEDRGFVSDLRAAGWDAESWPPVSMRSVLSLARRLGGYISMNRIDVLHAHLFYPSIVAAFAARRAGVPLVVTRHHADAVHAAPSAVKRRVLVMLDRFAQKRAAIVVVPSTGVMRYAHEVDRVPMAKMRVIPYGLEAQRFNSSAFPSEAAVRESLGLDRDAFVIVNVSRLYLRKGQPDLLHAFADLLRDMPHARLLLVGEGPDRAVIEALIEDLQIGHAVRVLGWRSDALAIVNAADMVAHPSREDALSSALMEALMLGKPVVAVDTAGVEDITDGGRYGEVVPPNDVRALRAAMQRVIDGIDAATARARQGGARLASLCSPARVAELYRDVYDDVVHA